MEEKGISKNLRERIKEIYTETRNKIRVNGKISEKFWTTRGARMPIEPYVILVIHSRFRGEIEKRLGRRCSC